MNGWSCFGIIVAIVVIFLILIAIAGVVLWKYATYKYEMELQLECSNFSGKSYTIPDLTPFIDMQYQPNNALSLLLINFNTTMSHCQQISMQLPSQFSVIETLLGNDDVIYGYFLYSSLLNLSLFTFTGTYGVMDWLYDVDIEQVSLPFSNAKGRVHEGFWTIYSQLRSKIASLLNKYSFKNHEVISKIGNDFTLIITGHSLGGALATLCTYEYAKLNPIVYTFGSPRVGDPEFASEYNALFNIIQGDSEEVANVWRVENTEDIVPTLPFPILMPSLLYQHVGVPHDFSINTGSYVKNHTDAYIDGIQTEINH